MHQTDQDGNWAGGHRDVKDSSWNIDLVGLHFDYDSVSRAPLQLYQYYDGSFQLHSFRGYDNDYSEEEMQFIEKFIPSDVKCTV